MKACTKTRTKTKMNCCTKTTLVPSNVNVLSICFTLVFIILQVHMKNSNSYITNALTGWKLGETTSSQLGLDTHNTLLHSTITCKDCIIHNYFIVNWFHCQDSWLWVAQPSKVGWVTTTSELFTRATTI